MNEPNEVIFTIDEEVAFINSNSESKDSLLMLAFVDGEYAGNCSFSGKK
jgi:hypothetical protein